MVTIDVSAPQRPERQGMINKEISRAFDLIADLMEIEGESGFRVNSYRRVARTLKSHDENLAVTAAENRLTEIPGVGKGIAEKINEFVATGKIAILEELKSKLPPELPKLLDIQNLGPKKIARLHAELGVETVDDLKAAIDSGRLEELSGFGKQSASRIRDGIAFLEKSGGRTPIGVAASVAETLSEVIRKMNGVQRVEIAGSLRRGAETIGDVDLLCQCDDGPGTVQAFTTLNGVQRVLAAGDTKGSVTFEIDGGRELQVDLRVVPAESFGAALQYFSGSKEHNVRLRERAVRRNLRLNEYGLYDGDTRVAGDTEESIYAALDVPWIPPELREDRGELDLDETPRLVTLEDIRGDLHMHTTASDGLCSIEEMADAAKKRGYKYIAVTDHSRSSVIANGLSIERLEAHIDAVRQADKKIKGITIFTGTECDILADGSLDYPDDVLAECDIVVASVHSGMQGGRVSGTARILKAIENPFVTIIGHPSGRLINRRPAMDIDIPTIAKAAAESNTALEINASWQRLDLKSDHVRQTIDAGAILVINTDAHHIDQLDQMRFGVATARRGGALPKSILNTQAIGGVKAWLCQKRS
jgi:DNA polymerase (family 10)